MKRLNFRNNYGVFFIALFLIQSISIVFTANTNYGYLDVQAKQNKEDVNHDITQYSFNDLDLIVDTDIPSSSSSSSINDLISSIDENNNLIFDTFENTLMENPSTKYPTLIVINSSSPNYNLANQFLSNYSLRRDAFQSLDNTIYSISLNKTEILTISNYFRKEFSHELNPLLYIKKDAEIQEQMLDGLNQLQLNTQEFRELELHGDSNMRMAVLDRGVDPTHPSMQNKDIVWQDFTVMEYESAVDYVGHGTAVAAVAVGDHFTALDAQGRTQVSMLNHINWGGTSSGWDIGREYIHFLGSMNISKTGTIYFEANYSVLEHSGIDMQAITIRNQNNDTVATNSIFPENTFASTTHIIDNPSQFGVYRFGYLFKVLESKLSTQHTIEGYVKAPIAVRNQSSTEPSDPNFTYNEFRGIAPNVGLAMLRVEYESDIIAAMNWLLDNAAVHNITTVCISLSIPSLEVFQLANQLVEKGIVVVVAAGNHYAGSNNFNSYSNSPASADLVITVGAVGRNNSLTQYSSQGGYSVTGRTIKPDLVALGGESTSLLDISTPLLLPDANKNEFIKELTYSQGDPVTIISLPERVLDDTRTFRGTSFSAPMVAGAVLLMMEKMGGMDNWNYSKQEALHIKNLLLMSATETAPAIRNGYGGDYSPELLRGGKDIHEGYGKLNILTALSLIDDFQFSNFTKETILYSPQSTEENQKHFYKYDNAIGFPLHAKHNFYHRFEVDSTEGHDLDIYIYRKNPNSVGDPVLLFNATSSSLFDIELIDGLRIKEDMDLYILIKSIIGFGPVNISISQIEDTISPEFANVYSPLENKFFSRNIPVVAYAYDQQTGIRNTVIYARKISNDEIPIKSEFSVVDMTDYGEEFLIDISNLNSGWYEFIFSFVDGGGNAINTSTIIYGIDNEAPKILSYFPETFTYHRGRIDFEVDITEDFSGISNISLYYAQQNQFNMIDVILFPTNLPLQNLEEQDDLILEKSHVLRAYTDSTWDGDKRFYIEIFDNSGNSVRTANIILHIQNYRMQLIEIPLIFGISVITIYYMNKVAKFILIKADIEKFIDSFQSLPENISRYINSRNFSKNDSF